MKNAIAFFLCYSRQVAQPYPKVMTLTSANTALRYLRTGDLKFSVLRDSLIALSDSGLSNLQTALQTAPDLHHGYAGAADLRSLLVTVECIQHYRATGADVLCRV